MQTVALSKGGIKLIATGSDTANWARKPGAFWPCSVLATHNLIAEFAGKGDLVALEIDGGRDDVDVPANEFNAFTSDCLRATGYGDHPAVKAGVA